MPSSWDDVIEAVMSERKYQQLLAPEQVENPVSLGEEIALIHKYLLKVYQDWSNDFQYPEVEALEGIRKIAAMAMRCMQNHGAIPRSSLAMHAAEVKARRAHPLGARDPRILDDIDRTLEPPDGVVLATVQPAPRLKLTDRNKGEDIVGS